MQVQKLLKRKKGVCSDVFQDGNELFFKKNYKPIEGSSQDATSASDQLENKQYDEKNCSSGMPKLLL